ncbi:methyl halide transferase [Entomortierella parvispora]|uniref:Methyl halide transferase n=1 Tax=Entomortierella parvispora TaxID=205924 RepID=A0A9P3H8D8_9FUNG|nr:methyl halide transferase [Entomortierella parvispora]
MNDVSKSIVQQPDGWNELWKRGIHPWDKSTPSPALVEVIEQKPIKDQIPQTGNVLVPGCGRGVDVFYLSNEHRKAYGLDISPIAVQQCKDIRAEKHIPESQAEFFEGDFFKFDIPAGGFQLVYDYTFFCAIQPEQRPDWGRRMGELIPKGGVLITLMYPLGDHTDGPPFAVSIEGYHALLDPNFECLLVDDCTSFDVRQGKEKIGVWRRK